MDTIGPSVMATTTTTISLRKETKEMLRRLGSKDQTYDEVIRDLIERASIKELDARWNRILEDEEFIPLDQL
jgi:predicted CopG family antitoxin